MATLSDEQLRVLRFLAHHAANTTWARTAGVPGPAADGDAGRGLVGSQAPTREPHGRPAQGPVAPRKPPSGSDRPGKRIRSRMATCAQGPQQRPEQPGPRGPRLGVVGDARVRYPSKQIGPGGPYRKPPSILRAAALDIADVSHASQQARLAAGIGSGTAPCAQGWPRCEHGLQGRRPNRAAGPSPGPGYQDRPGRLEWRARIYPPASPFG